MKKNLVIAALALLAVIGFGWGFYEANKTDTAATRIENDASRAFYELVDATDELTVLTGKALVVSDSDRRADLYAKISSKAYVAQENLAMLPVYNGSLSRTESFLNQVGDFSASLVAKAARNEALTQEEAETMQNLNGSLNQVAKALHKMENSKENIFSYKAIQTASKSLKKSDGENAGTAYSSLTNMNQNVSKTPSLIYDGPYSDHLENKGQVTLSGELIDWNTAKEKAKALFGTELSYEAYGKSSKAAGFAVYTVAVKENENEDHAIGYLDISVHGGYPVQYTANKEPGKAAIGTEEALTTAADFLALAGYNDMQPGYHITEDNIITINFMAHLGDTVVYPDMIKVSVDLATGKIAGLDAKNYLEFHKDRTMPMLTLTKDAAAAHLPAGVPPEAVQKAIIQKNNGSEVLCYEFRFQKDDTEYLLYINAENGREEDIFIVKDNESGTFML